MDDNIKIEITEDLTFNESTLQDKLIDLPLIHAKYADLYSKYNRELIVAKHEFNKLVKERFDHYKTKSQIIYDNKDIRERILPGDPAVLKAQAKVDILNDKLQYIDKILYAVKAVGFNIKSYIEWHKFKNGI